MKNKLKRYHILVIMRNQLGGAARISSLFTRRGFNIENITAGTSICRKNSRLTITVTASEIELDQIVKQVYKQIDVIKVKIGEDSDTIKRELLLIKINCEIIKRSNVIELSNIFGAKILNVTPKTLIIELLDNEDVVDNFISLMENYGILEIARTGVIAMSKGDKF